MKAIYIGSGWDVNPIVFLNHIKDWVYIDCKPFSEFGVRVHKCDTRWCSKKCLGFKRPCFIPRIRKEMERIGMKYKKISDNELEFTNETQRVTFFVNTSMPEHIYRVENRIQDFNHWIIMGHDPNIAALEHTSQNITFWGNTNTVYTKDSTEDRYYNEFKDELCFQINRNKKVRNRFSHFNIIKGDSVTSFGSWENFIIQNRKDLQQDFHNFSTSEL